MGCMSLMGEDCAHHTTALSITTTTKGLNIGGGESFARKTIKYKPVVHGGYKSQKGSHPKLKIQKP